MPKKLTPEEQEQVNYIMGMKRDKDGYFEESLYCVWGKCSRSPTGECSNPCEFCAEYLRNKTQKND